MGPGHPGTQRLAKAADTYFKFPPTCSVSKIVNEIRTNCLVCQACESPNISLKQPLRMNPIIKGFWTSVCLEIFSLPPVEWEGEAFDCILACVDRATNWIIARLTVQEGLTGEKAVKLLLDGGW